MAGAHGLVSAGVLQPEDQVLALEPTSLRLRIAVGLRWLQMRVRGRMAHAGRAHRGVGANQAAARMVDYLRARVAYPPYRDELLGRPRFTCRTIRGSVGVNVVPPSCVARLNLRFAPPMSSDDVLELVRELGEATAAGFPGGEVEVQPLGPACPPVRAADDARVVTRLRGAFKDVTGSKPASGGADGHEAYTDALMVSVLTGSTSRTVFGPGSSDHAHTADEYVDIEDIAVAAHVLERAMADW